MVFSNRLSGSLAGSSRLLAICRRLRLLTLFGLLLPLFVACSATRRYTSLDLALLPCESGDSPRFFLPIELDSGGEVLYAGQLEAIRGRLTSGIPVTDIVVFVHGWNKNPSSAELDYQNFLCRLHGRLRDTIAEEKRQGGLMAIGVFWPSTITNRPREPWLVKPLSYFKIRERADREAEAGLPAILRALVESAEGGQRPLPTRLHLIGHSFGGRMIVGSLQTLQDDGNLVPFLSSMGAANVILVNAAVPADRFDWIESAWEAAQREKRRARFTDATASYLFNVHSFEDSANKKLFPLASLFNEDRARCAAGACGVPGYPTLCVDHAGQIVLSEEEVPPVAEGDAGLNVWNVDATKIIHDHSDIYKGRVANLLADLLYDLEERRRFPRRASGPSCRR